MRVVLLGILGLFVFSLAARLGMLLFLPARAEFGFPTSLPDAYAWLFALAVTTGAVLLMRRLMF